MHTSAFLLRCLVRLTQQATSPKTAASDTSWLTALVQAEHGSGLEQPESVLRELTNTQRK